MAPSLPSAQFLVPEMGTLPVSSCRYYQTATITGLLGTGGSTEPITAALAIPEPDKVDAGIPAEGVLLTHRQQWVIAGTALGPLLHSVCLAPGEITQIAVRNQTRQVADKSVDHGLQVEQTTSTGDSSSDVAESERTSAADASAGTSVAGSFSSTVEAGVGGLIGLLGVSAGGSTTLASGSQAAFSSGTRSVSDQANQSVHQSARDQAQLARSRSTAAVREVAEADTAEINTRVIANYNHMHALTMEYFEVEQVYQLRTTVTDAERLIFVPMGVIDFSNPNQATAAISRYRNELIDVAGDLGLHHVVAKLAAERLSINPTGSAGPATEDTDGESAEDAAAKLAKKTATADGKRAKTLADELQDELAEQVKKQKELDAAVDAEAAARDAVRAAREGSLVDRTRTQRVLQQAIAFTRAARSSLLDAGAAVRAAEAAYRQTQWEDEQRRLATDLTDEDLRDTLSAHQLAVNQGIWLRLDPSTTSAFLQRRVHAGKALGDVVDPTPVAVSGNLLGFKWRFRDPAEEAVFLAEHTAAETAEIEHSVAVPTGGVFGEAVLGTSIGAERIDLTRFWNWKDALPPLRPAQIAAQEVKQPTDLAAPKQGQVPESHVNLAPVEFPEVTSRLPAVVNALANPELFRDMSGQQTATALAKSAMELSASGAGTAAQLASDNFKRFLKFQHTVASTLLEAAQQKKVDPTMAGGRLNAKQGDATDDASTDSAEEFASETGSQTDTTDSGSGEEGGSTGGEEDSTGSAGGPTGNASGTGGSPNPAGQGGSGSTGSGGSQPAGQSGGTATDSSVGGGTTLDVEFKGGPP